MQIRCPSGDASRNTRSPAGIRPRCAVWVDPDVLDGAQGPHVGLGGVHKLVVDHLLWRGVSAKEDRRGVNIGDRSMTVHGAVAPPPGNGAGHVAKQSVAVTSTRQTRLHGGMSRNIRSGSKLGPAGQHIWSAPATNGPT